MTSRIKRATFTVVSFAGLALLGLLVCSLYAVRASAQRISAPPRGQQPYQFSTNSQFPGTAQPEFRADTRTDPAPLPVANFTQPPTYENQPFNSSTALSMQPIAVAIKNGPQLSGEPVGLSTLQVKTIFGPVSIPLDRIAGVRIADDPRQPATICLSNGDSLTGALANDAITIKTEWGTATVTRDHIVSITTSTEPVTWQQHEGRWRIVPNELVPNADHRDDFKTGAADADLSPQVPQFEPAATPIPSPAAPAPALEPSPS